MWDYCDRKDVTQYSGFAESRLQDSWSEMVEAMINEYVGKSFGATSAYSESYDGDGTDTLFLDNVPVVSVSSLVINDVNVTSSEYKVYEPGYIRLVSNRGTPIKESMGETAGSFPIGQQNVDVSYTAGELSVPGNVRLAAILMITQLAMISERAGSEGSLALAMAGGQKVGDSGEPSWRLDVSGRLRRILRTLIGEKWRFR